MRRPPGILAAPATVPGRVYSRFELINRVRGYESEGYERTAELARAHGGRLTAGSQPGHGTQMTLTVPAA
jgi:signal transduction histidine kinase